MTPLNPHRALQRRSLALAIAAWLVFASSAARADDGDPNLDQTLAPGAAIAGGERVLDIGHVDLGPKFDEDGAWRLLVHDDVAKADADAESVWRRPEEVVLRAGEAATLTVPDDDAYSFVGAAPGETVWVVPQTQNPDVVWVGWNTQDPEVMAVIDRGVTLSLTGVQGPGTMTTYLQSGSFGAPQILWDSRVSDPQPIWVDVNTHTHANWVFTEPGVYLVRIEAAADLLDGTSVADTQVIRFAIGEAASTAEALAAEWDVGDAGEPGGVAAGEAGAGEAGAAGAGEAAAGDAGEANAAGAAPPSDAPSSDTGGTEAPASGTEAWTPILIGVIALVAVGLVVGFGVEVVRGNRAKRRVLAARRADGEGGEGR